MPASFRANRCRWSTAVCYAIAHVRGGSDKGWAGISTASARKDHSFDDFAAAGARWPRRTTHRESIVGHAPAPGMLMGASPTDQATVRRHCRRSAFVDLLNTMLDDTLPLTPPEWPEWGNPIESETDFLPSCPIRLKIRPRQRIIRKFSRWRPSPIPA